MGDDCTGYIVLASTAAAADADDAVATDAASGCIGGGDDAVAD